MHARHVLPLLLTLPLWACAQDGGGTSMDRDADVVPEGPATGLPEGYEIRLDRETSDPADFRVVDEDVAFHIQTGPAAIFYTETDVVDADVYTVSAEFTQIGVPPNHPEALGIFVGGSDLQGEDQRYTYFLMRADGQYLVKRREGAETFTVNDGWTPSEAINPARVRSDITNVLSVTVEDDSVRFSINGTEVFAGPSEGLETRGVVGLRINHNLDLRVCNWRIEV